MNMEKKVKRAANFIEHYVNQGRELPSRLDVSAVPKSQEQEYIDAIAKLCKEHGVTCPEINFVPDDPLDFVNYKIDGIFAGIANKTKLGKDVQIRLNFDEIPGVRYSMLARLQARLEKELGYTMINGSREHIYNDDDKQVAVVMSFEKAKESLQNSPVI